MHWLVFNLLWHSVGTGRLVDGEVNLRDCKRFSTEIQETLAVILQAADKIGYARPETKDEAEESGKEKQIQRGSLLDIKDNAGQSQYLELLLRTCHGSSLASVMRAVLPAQPHLLLTDSSREPLFSTPGNTALHYAVSHARVDAVALLLSFGAHYEPKNNCGESPWTDGRIDWMNKADEAKSTATAMPTANSNAMMDTSEDKAAPLTGAVPFVVFGSNVHPLIQHFDTKLYESTEFEAERAWGLREGLRLEQPSYVGESDTAAIRRLLFQAALAHATDEGDNGSLSTVKKLVKIYKHESVGKKMFPLAYRGDAFYYSPLQTAVAYEDTSTGILDQLLQLPFLLHTQSRATEFPALTRAIFCRNFVGAKHLLEAGYNVNFRDSATGATAIVS